MADENPPSNQETQKPVQQEEKPNVDIIPPTLERIEKSLNSEED